MEEKSFFLGLLVMQGKSDGNKHQLVIVFEKHHEKFQEKCSYHISFEKKNSYRKLNVFRSALVDILINLGGKMLKLAL